MDQAFVLSDTFQVSERINRPSWPSMPVSSLDS